MKDAENKSIWIAVGKSRRTLKWRNERTGWAALAARLAEPEVTGETVAEYDAMTAAGRGEAKDVGGFVGGWLEDGSRRGGGLCRRTLLTLDLDSLPPWEGDAEGSARLARLVDEVIPGTAYVLYSTHSHRTSAPRMRLVVPLATPAGPEAAEAAGRAVAAGVGFGYFDRTTFEPQRLFYWPSTQSDREPVYVCREGEPLDLDGFLGRYADWRDISLWPRHPLEEGLVPRTDTRLADPREKRGYVGAWCRRHTLEEVIREDLAGVYLPELGGRYTYAAGSTTGGAVLYNDGQYLWSHHATDPAHGHGRNAFDLVRIHRFGHLDAGLEEGKAGAPDSPSYQRMVSYCITRDPEIRRIIVGERTDEAAPRPKAAEGSAGSRDRDGEVRDRVEATVLAVLERGGTETRKDSGRLAATRDNVRLILDCDPAFRSLRYDDFAKRIEADTAGLPWPRGQREWSDRDDAALRVYLERWYGIGGKERVFDAMESLLTERTVHPVREWLRSLEWDGRPRIRHLFTRVLGADDTPLNERLAELLMTGLVARVTEPGVKFDYCITLMGPQGCGKSSFLSALVGSEWFSDSLKDLTNKDAMVSLQGKWLLELGEMTAAKRADDNQVKSFISSRSDSFRPPYGRRLMDFPRQCVMVGTTNDRDFLYSQPGQVSRRLPVVEVKPELRRIEGWPADMVTAERGQLFAEAYLLWTSARPPLYLTAEENEEVARIQEGFSKATLDPTRGLVDAWLELPVPLEAWKSQGIDQRRYFASHGGTLNEGNPPEDTYAYRETVCTAEIVEELFCIDRGRGEFSKQARAVGNMMNNHPDWVPLGIRATTHYGKQRVWRRKVAKAAPQESGKMIETLHGVRVRRNELPF